MVRRATVVEAQLYLLEEVQTVSPRVFASATLRIHLAMLTGIVHVLQTYARTLRIRHKQSAPGKGNIVQPMEPVHVRHTISYRYMF